MWSVILHIEREVNKIIWALSSTYIVAITSMTMGTRMAQPLDDAWRV